MKDNVKTYTCKVCKGKYDLLASIYARRSLSPHGQLKSCCLKKDCEIESKSKAAMKYIENKKKKERNQDNQKETEHVEILELRPSVRNEKQFLFRFSRVQQKALQKENSIALPARFCCFLNHLTRASEIKPMKRSARNM